MLSFDATLMEAQRQPLVLHAGTRQISEELTGAERPLIQLRSEGLGTGITPAFTATEQFQAMVAREVDGLCLESEPVTEIFERSPADHRQIEMWQSTEGL